MKITVKEGKAYVETPYNKEFVSKIKQIGGARWNSASRCWMVPEAEIDTVRTYMKEVYGETDLPDEGERITIDVTFDEDVYEWDREIVLFGRQLCRAFGRDSGAKVSDGVTLIEGEIGSGGSRNNYNVWAHAGAKFRIRNLPLTALNIESPYKVTVVEVQKDSIDREALMAEKAKLMARLAEINALLGE